MKLDLIQQKTIFRVKTPPSWTPRIEGESVTLPFGCSSDVQAGFLSPKASSSGSGEKEEGAGASSLVFRGWRRLFYLGCMASCLDADHAEVSLEAGFHFVDVATTLLVALTQSWAAIFKEKAKHRIF